MACKGACVSCAVMCSSAILTSCLLHSKREGSLHNLYDYVPISVHACSPHHGECRACKYALHSCGIHVPIMATGLLSGHPLTQGLILWHEAQVLLPAGDGHFVWHSLYIRLELQSWLTCSFLLKSCLKDFFLLHHTCLAACICTWA